MIKKRSSAYVQAFRMSNNERKLIIIGEWLLFVLTKMETHDAGKVLTEANKVAKDFTNRPIFRQEDPIIDWYLGDDWFKELFAQALEPHKEIRVEEIYKRLKWDYFTALNPMVTNSTTLEEFDLTKIIENSAPVNLTLVSRDRIPIGQVWENISLGTLWVVIGKSDKFENAYEIENSKGHIIVRTAGNLFKHFKKVNNDEKRTS